MATKTPKPTATSRPPKIPKRPAAVTVTVQPAPPRTLEDVTIKKWKGRTA
jgi:hypothetical protein